MVAVSSSDHGLPSTIARVGSSKPASRPSKLCQRVRWRELPAGGSEFVCPACDGTESVAHRVEVIVEMLRGLWTSGVGDRGHHFPGDPYSVVRLVPTRSGGCVSQKNGASALGLQRVLGLGSYRTAWTWLHKLRRAMVRPGRDRVALEEVEVDRDHSWAGCEAGGGRTTPGEEGAGRSFATAGTSNLSASPAQSCRRATCSRQWVAPSLFLRPRRHRSPWATPSPRHRRTMASTSAGQRAHHRRTGVSGISAEWQRWPRHGRPRQRRIRGHRVGARVG